MSSKVDSTRLDELSESSLDERSVTMRSKPTRPCSKSGPSQADSAVAAQLKDKMGGRLKGHLSPERVCCARQIVGVVKEQRLPERAAVIAIATAIIESNLINAAYGDRDSLGLFQQRTPWGTAEQRLDPKYATKAFLKAMLHNPTILGRVNRSAWFARGCRSRATPTVISQRPDRRPSWSPRFGARAAARCEPM